MLPASHPTGASHAWHTTSPGMGETISPAPTVIPPNAAERSQVLPNSFSFAGCICDLKHGVVSVLARHNGRAGGDKPCSDLWLGPVNHSWDLGYKTSPKTQQFGALFTPSRRCQSTRSPPQLGWGDALPCPGPPRGCIPHQGDTTAPPAATDLSTEQSGACHRLPKTHTSSVLTSLGRKKPPRGSLG